MAKHFAPQTQAEPWPDEGTGAMPTAHAGAPVDPGETAMWVASLEASRRVQRTPAHRSSDVPQGAHFRPGPEADLEPADSTGVFMKAAAGAQNRRRARRTPGKAVHVSEEGRARLRDLAVEEAMAGVHAAVAVDVEGADAVPPVTDGPGLSPQGLEEGSHDMAPGAPALTATEEWEAIAMEPDLAYGEPVDAIDVGEFHAPADLAEEPGAVVAEGGDEREAEAGASSTDLENQVGRSSAAMSVLVLISRLTGFLRSWSQAYALGVTVVASCYTVANNLPSQLYDLVVGGMLVTAFLPVYMSVKRKAGRDAANRYTSNLVSLVSILMGAVTVFGIVFAYQVVLTQSVGATSEFDYGLATYLFRFFAVEVLLYALSSIFSGVLNAERDYLWSMAAPIFNNFICMASFFGYAFFLDSNPTLAVLLLAIGNPAGVLVQVLMLVPSLRRQGIKIRPYVDLHDPALKETLSIGVPSIAVTICTFVTVSVQSSCALQVTASGAAVIYYARLWFSLPYAILVVPITTTMFTELSELASRNDTAGFKRGIGSGSARILFFMAPFGLFLIVFAPELISMLNSGNFTAEETSMTAQYLCMLGLGLPFYGLCMYLQKICSAQRAMTFYAVANIVGSAIQVAVCVFCTPIWGLNMVGLSSSIYFVAVDVVTFLYLRRKIGALGLGAMAGSFVRSFAVGVAGAAVGAAILWACGTYLGLTATGLLTGLILCVLGGVPALLVTYGLALALKMPEARFLRSLLGRA